MWNRSFFSLIVLIDQYDKNILFNNNFIFDRRNRLIKNIIIVENKLPSNCNWNQFIKRILFLDQ